MPRPDNPYAPRRPGEDLTEVLLRLDLMERKLDWIARRVAALAHVEGDAPAHEPPAAQRAEPAEPGLWPQPSPADAADATEPAEPDRSRPSPADESAPTPSPRPWTPVEPRPRPAAPGASPPESSRRRDIRRALAPTPHHAHAHRNAIDNPTTMSGAVELVTIPSPFGREQHPRWRCVRSDTTTPTGISVQPKGRKRD